MAVRVSAMSECLPCLVRQAVDTIGRIGMAPDAQQAMMQEVFQLMSTLDLSLPAPVMAQQIHRLIRTQLGGDPYQAIKAEGNALALQWYPTLRAQVQAADDPLAMALRVAIAGNIIDYGVKHRVDRAYIEATLSRALTIPLDAQTLEAFRHAIASADTILYLADNAGEIVFDRLLIECLPREKVTLVVRGLPVLNDATREDAATAGLDKIVEVLDNGTDVPGTVLEQCPPAFRQRFATADVVIAKGQGNFETLVNAGRSIFHLFVAKCAMVAKLVNSPLDTPIFQCRNSAEREPAGIGTLPFN